MIEKRSVTEKIGIVGKGCVTKTGIPGLIAVNPNCAMAMTLAGPTISLQHHLDIITILIR
jgi:hypothetical protein